MPYSRRLILRAGCSTPATGWPKQRGSDGHHKQKAARASSPPRPKAGVARSATPPRVRLRRRAYTQGKWKLASAPTSPAIPPRDATTPRRAESTTGPFAPITHLPGAFPCPQSDSNRHWADFKSAASANWAMGATQVESLAGLAFRQLLPVFPNWRSWLRCSAICASGRGGCRLIADGDALYANIGPTGG